MNSDSEIWMIAAEKICRREYEIAFDTDLSLPIGTFYGFETPDEMLDFAKSMCAFWNKVGGKYYDKYKGEHMIDELPTLHPLTRSIAMFCMHMESSMNVYIRNEYEKVLKEFDNKKN